MIVLLYVTGGVEVRVEVSGDIATCDLLEVLDAFVRSTGREPSGELDYITSTL